MRIPIDPDFKKQAQEEGLPMFRVLFQMFPDEETARLYLESRLWPKGVTCPTCAGQDRITPRKAGFHRCNKCQLDFTIRTGTRRKETRTK
jgi:hypothetical protein